jgi:hypothetical protein
MRVSGSEHQHVQQCALYYSSTGITAFAAGNT